MTALAKKVAELFGKPEKGKKTPLTVVPPRPAPDAWPCPTCQGAVAVEDTSLSLDGTRTLLWWRCHSCSTWGVAIEGSRLPLAWVTTREEQ